MAKRDKFRYEMLLKLRRRVEDERKRAVAERLREIHALEERRRMLLERIEQQTQQTRETLQSQRVDLDDLRLSRHWMLRLRRGVLETETALRSQHGLLAEERQRLAAASKDAEVLSRLKDRQAAALVVEMNRREQMELDEMNVTRYARATAAVEADAR